VRAGTLWESCGFRSAPGFGRIVGLRRRQRAGELDGDSNRRIRNQGSQRWSGSPPGWAVKASAKTVRAQRDAALEIPAVDSLSPDVSRRAGGHILACRLGVVRVGDYSAGDRFNLPVL
jgi:hypothetical protein